MIIKTDKKRASYYNYYTNKKWSDSESYELCLSSSELGIEGTAKAIEQYVMLKEQIQRDDKILQKLKNSSPCRKDKDFYCRGTFYALG